jgi:hypothetical protein
MHPDLDLQGVLQAAYRQELHSNAARARLLKQAKLQQARPGWVKQSWRRVADALQWRDERASMEFGEVVQ